jgi:hypothetical protein
MRGDPRIAFLMVVALPLLAYAQSPTPAPYRCQGSQNVANCPPCYYNYVPVDSGMRPDGRAIANVFIENEGAGSKLWNATQAGMEKWNTATDTSSQPGTTKRPPVYFAGNQNRDDANIVVKFDESVTLAEIDINVSPPVLRIDPFYAQQLTEEELAAVIAHEIAHPYGLGNAYRSGSGCERATTIMRGATADRGRPAVLDVQERDVYQMNVFWNSRQACCANAEGRQTIEEDPCLDGDADGVSVCDGDCDDFDPSLTYDCSYYSPEPGPTPGGGGGGGSCYREYECTEYWTCGEDAYGYGCEYQGVECGQTGYCQCGGYYTYCPY